MTELARRITESDAFASAVAMLIVANGLLLGLEAIDGFTHDWGGWLSAFFWCSQGCFVAEIALRIVAEGAPFRRFFADPWNRFDFFLVVASLLPMVGPLAPMARLLRILRVLRVFSAFSSLRDVVEGGGLTGGATWPSAAITGVFWYGFAIAGHTFFSELDPARWGDLFLSFRTVFFLSVLTDVSETVTPVTDVAPGSLVYFLAFYVGMLGIVLQTLAAAVRPPVPTAGPT